MQVSSYITNFSDIRLTDIATVGGKNASLGEMLSELSSSGIRVPDGFAITTYAFEEFLTHNSLHAPLYELMAELDKKGFSNLSDIGGRARDLLRKGALPRKLFAEILNAYRELGNGDEVPVAVRSSATAEDLPQASFAGQHESFLNVKGDIALEHAVKKCFVSLYTDRAIKYREDNKFPHEKVFLSVGVQLMVRADLGASGVVFTLEPESGFREVIHISGVWGLGENLVQGTVTPDEFLVFKPTLLLNKNAILQRRLGEKGLTMIYGQDPDEPLQNVPTIETERNKFVLSDKEAQEIAYWSLLIEKHYGRPMDVEWAKDGLTEELFILQARPESVQSRKEALVLTEYKLLALAQPVLQGQAIGSKIASGIARICKSPADAVRVMPGEIVVTNVTSPDWDPVLKNAGAIITNNGGRTSHASIVARELGVPALVGCGNATSVIKDGSEITVSCAEGKIGHVFLGVLPFEQHQIDLTSIRKPDTPRVMMIIADPDQAFRLSFYPNDGVGLLRMEFIITHSVRIHPMALVHFQELQDEQVKKMIDGITIGYQSKQSYFVEKLAEGIATIAAAFYPKEVIVRTSDFKTNEYAGLLGGRQFEPVEENPMIGFRGASRYDHPLYKDGFALECEAIRQVRDDMGLTNVKVMIPFCRTVREGIKVLNVMKEHGLARGKNNLQVYVMAEIPANVLLADKFAEIFDGFSIGSNDLTQLTLGVDRDSSILQTLFDEQDEAAKQMISMIIHNAHAAGRKVGLCGQAPSDNPEFARFIVELGIDSIAFNSDAILKGIEAINKIPPAKARSSETLVMK